MKRKLLLLLFIYITTSFSLTLFQSCEDFWNYKGHVCDIEFLGMYNISSDIQPDTLTTHVGFKVTAYPNESCYITPTFNFIAPCYAFTKCANWQNEIVQSSFKLSLDRQVIISNDTIIPNTDLFQKISFVNAVKVTKDESECKAIQYYMEFGSDMFIFEQGIYKATFTCSTNDSRTFTKQREVIFRL